MDIPIESALFELTPEQRQLKQKFIEDHRYWNSFWDGLLTLSPSFFKAYMEFSGVPWRAGYLEPKTKELIYIAIDVVTTHLYEKGLRIHIDNAFKIGITKEEIMEVYQLVSVIGMHTFTMGMPALLDGLREAGIDCGLDTPLDARRIALKEEFVSARGYWNTLWDNLLKLDPNFFEAYVRFSSVPWKEGTLPPKIKEFIYIAINAATTKLYEPGLRFHIRNALKFGATKEEIMEVYQITSCLGMHTCTVGVPILLEELSKAPRVPAEFHS